MEITSWAMGLHLPDISKSRLGVRSLLASPLPPGPFYPRSAGIRQSYVHDMYSIHLEHRSVKPQFGQLNIGYLAYDTALHQAVQDPRQAQRDNETPYNLQGAVRIK